MSKRITPAVIAPPEMRGAAPQLLWDHQVDAIASIHAGAARQQVAMACGTGKTVTGQHAAYTFLQGRPGAILILTPTLALLKQTYDSWKDNAPFAFRAIAVCSTLTTAEKREAGAEGDIAVTDLPLPATTDADVLTEFITANTDDVRVVFGTYQSLGVIIDAHTEHHLPQWDVVLCDEAHRTAGDRTKMFARVLYDHYVPAVHRLFLTATPKVHDISKGNGALLASMDDPELYGKRVYTITVKDAVELGILSEYKVAVIGVLDNELDKAHAAIGHATVDGKRLSMDHLATIVALSKAARERDLHAVIAFFNSIPASKEFTAAFTTVHAALGEGTAEHIDGHMKLSVRDEALTRLAAKRNKGFHLVSNARCLSEGIDVPVLDAIVFGEPRSGQIDVVQCAGRAIRRNPRSDDPALIVLAVRIGAGEDPDAAVAKSDFKKVRQVISALEDHDPRIVEAMHLLIRDSASEKESGESGDELDKNVPDTWVGDDADGLVVVAEGEVVPVGDRTTPAADEKRGAVEVKVPGTVEWAKQLISLDIPKRLLTNGFTLRILDVNDRSYEEGLAAVRGYVAVNGHARIPQRFVSSDGHRTGEWVGRRRADYVAGTLSGDRIDELESLPGWMWSALDGQWLTALSAIRSYANENGHVNVPDRYMSPDGHRTGQWVKTRRLDYAEGKLSAERIAELESIPGWVWSALDGQWLTGLSAIRSYANENGHAFVPQRYVSPDGHRTGLWVNRRRLDYAEGKLSAERIAELESIPGWVWSARDEQWLTGLAAVRGYTAANGHANVPKHYVSPEGHRTGQWVNSRRGGYFAGKLSAERIAELESIPGWVWSALNDSLWVDGLAAVRGYTAANGHANVPKHYVSPDGHRTGQWVNGRRGGYFAGKLSAERIAELESIPGWAWSARDEQWLTGLAAVRSYTAEKGSARIPFSYVSLDGHRTGLWVNNRRRDYADGRLSAERIAELESIPGWVWRAS